MRGLWHYAPTSTFLHNNSARVPSLNQRAVAEKCTPENIWSQEEYSTKLEETAGWTALELLSLDFSKHRYDGHVTSANDEFKRS